MATTIIWYFCKHCATAWGQISEPQNCPHCQFPPEYKDGGGCSPEVWERCQTAHPGEDLCSGCRHNQRIVPWTGQPARGLDEWVRAATLARNGR